MNIYEALYNRGGHFVLMSNLSLFSWSDFGQLLKSCSLDHTLQNVFFCGGGGGGGGRPDSFHRIIVPRQHSRNSDLLEMKQCAYHNKEKN